ncbi:hypothetical protein [Streptomyces diastaticus]|uniref:hypothetical protein n=1 Tax=Streptomyces diastaticus TaxID=1956 RepID=UPI0037F11F3B
MNTKKAASKPKRGRLWTIRTEQFYTNIAVSYATQSAHVSKTLPEKIGTRLPKAQRLLIEAASTWKSRRFSRHMVSLAPIRGAIPSDSGGHMGMADFFMVIVAGVITALIVDWIRPPR